MINLTYIAQFDTNGILTALYIVITYIQTNRLTINGGGAGGEGDFD